MEAMQKVWLLGAELKEENLIKVDLNLDLNPDIEMWSAIIVIKWGTLRQIVSN